MLGCFSVSPRDASGTLLPLVSGWYQVVFSRRRAVYLFVVGQRTMKPISGGPCSLVGGPHATLRFPEFSAFLSSSTRKLSPRGRVQGSFAAKGPSP